MNGSTYMRERYRSICADLMRYRTGAVNYNHRHVQRLQAERRAFAALTGQDGGRRNRRAN